MSQPMGRRASPRPDLPHGRSPCCRRIQRTSYGAFLLWVHLGCLPHAAVAAPVQSVFDPAGVQAARILDLWHLTLAVCWAVFAAILMRAHRVVRAPRGQPRTPPDLYASKAPSRACAAR